MKQLYYTSCKSGRSVKGLSGFQVRAASSELSSDQQTQIVALARYDLPAGMPDEVEPEQAPRRLALVDAPGLGRVLSHTTYVGPDPDTGRLGNYFFHAVVGSPQELDALTAIRCWRSPFWKTCDFEGPTNLPEVRPSDLTPGPSFRENLLPTFANTYRKELEFLLSGWLAAAPEQRLFLVADANVMAACVYCLLHAIPQEQRADVTFSTFERHLLTSSPRIVATSWDENQSRDLESQCYDGAGLGFNGFTGKSSAALRVPAEFASFALGALGALDKGRLDDLQGFLQECQRLQVSEGPGVARLYRLLHGKQQLTSSDLCQRETQRVADRIVDRQEFPALVANAALVDPNFRAKAWPVYLKAARTKRPVLDKIADAVRTQGLEALKTGDLAVARVALEELASDVEPTFKLGPTLLHSVVDPQSLPLNTRFHFLPGVLAEAHSAPDERVKAWLRAAPNDLPKLLACVAKESHRLVAVDLAFERTGVELLPSATIAALAESPAFGLKVVARLASRTPDKAVKLLERLVEHSSKHDWASDLLRDDEPGAPILAPPCRDQLLETAIARVPQPMLRAWIVANAKRLQQGFPDGAATVAAASRILREFSDHWIGDSDMASFVRWLRTSPRYSTLPMELRQQVEFQFGIKAFCETPSLDVAKLRAVASALKQLPDQDIRPTWQRLLSRIVPVRRFSVRRLRDAEFDRVLTALVPILLTHRGDNSQIALERVLAHLGPSYSESGPWVPLFRELLERCECDRRFWQNDGTLGAFVAVGVGEIRSDELRAQADPGRVKLESEMEQFILTNKTRQSNSAAMDDLRDRVHKWTNTKRAGRWEYRILDANVKDQELSWTSVIVILLTGYLLGVTIPLDAIQRVLRAIIAGR